MEDRPEFKTEMYNRICDSVIMQYKNPNSTIVEAVTADENEEMIADQSDENN